ncbi:hypothetical protein [Gordonia aquimaris]|uniref:Uncharacterized protein n=1 Tax=Gordonia aquimaris TaxID=2984863 RepID=A0A9X3D819_9ACTN|nr:hypothetical protein [Gordonia aquimaris]MCX2965401.1 hypothetical protein [Gordonia aquimaris]
MSAFIMTLAALPTLSTTALGQAYSSALSGFGLLVGLAIYPTVLRLIDRTVTELGEPHVARRDVVEHYLTWAAIGFALSVPITLGMLSNDLEAMAVSAVVADSADSFTEAGHPSYSVCSPLKLYLGYPLSKPCYNAVGYLHLWQIKPALSIMISLVGLCIGLPLQLLAQIRASSQPKPGVPE